MKGYFSKVNYFYFSAPLILLNVNNPAGYSGLCM
jgi:hypothetical protein